MIDEANQKVRFSEDQARLLEMVTRLFPNENHLDILGLLEEYGNRAHEREVFRVRQNILKLSNGQKNRIPELVKQAKTDYRDIIVAAEYEPASKEEAAKSLEVIAEMLIRSGQEKEAEVLKKEAKKLKPD